MTKPIKVSDEVHARLSTLAKENYRSIGAQIEYMMDSTKQVVTSGYIRTELPGQMDIDELIQGDKAQHIPEKFDSAARNKGDVLEDIRSTEAEMEEQLRFNQDPDSRHQFELDYRRAIAELWAEYREME